MAISTIDLNISPDDGWVQVAVNPTSLLIKPRTFHNWWVAVTASGAPAASLLGVPMGNDAYDRDEPFESGQITGEVYIRITTPPDSVVGSKMGFGVIRDQ
jgi:hypothetical protein